MINTLGNHYIIEASGCNPAILNDIELIEEIMVQAAKEAKASVVTSAFHRFYPQGVSGVVVVSESHISIHTWPEKGYAAIDIYTCGENTTPDDAVYYILRALQAQNTQITYLARGLKNKENYYHLIETDSFKL